MTRLFAALLAALTAIAAATAPKAETGADTARTDPPRAAKLMTLTAGEAAMERRFYGRVTARETVDLAFQVGGQLLAFAAEEGRRVDGGAVIAQLDLAPFRRRVEQARVNLDKAARDHKRLVALEGSAVSEVQIHDAKTKLDLARIALDDAEDQLDKATLQAPFDALIARRQTAAFATVAAGQPIVRVHDMSEMRVQIDVPEVMFRRAQGADDVTFRADFPGDPKSYPLVLREFEAETADVGQTFRLTLAFVDKPGAWLLPGASATVTAKQTHGRDKAVFLPKTALQFDADRAPFVLRFVPDGGNPDMGTVARQQVRIRMQDDGRIAMTEGPAEGTEIVMTVASQLRDGQSVRRFTGIGN